MSFPLGDLNPQPGAFAGLLQPSSLGCGLCVSGVSTSDNEMCNAPKSLQGGNRPGTVLNLTTRRIGYWAMELVHWHIHHLKVFPLHSPPIAPASLKHWALNLAARKKLDSSHFGLLFLQKIKLNLIFVGVVSWGIEFEKWCGSVMLAGAQAALGDLMHVSFKDVSEPRAFVCLSALGVLWLFALECSFVALLQATVDECLPCLLYAKAWLRIPTGPFFVLRSCRTAGPNWKLWLLAPGSQAGVWPAGLSMLFRKSLFCIKLAVLVFGGGCFSTQKGNGTVPLWFWFLRMGIKVNDQECDVLVKASWASLSSLDEKFLLPFVCRQWTEIAKVYWTQHI